MKKLFGVLLFLITILLSGCAKTKTMAWEQLRFFEVFGNISVSVTVISEEDRIKNEMEEAWNDIDEILTNLDDVFSIHHSGSQVETIIQKINRNAGIKAVEVTDEVILVLEKAIEVGNKSIDSNGVAQYDVTVAPLWKAWDFVSNEQTVVDSIPTEEELEELIDLVDYKKIKIDKDAKTVFLEKEGMGLDLGSIVKGYAADVIKEYLLSKEFTQALINVGGNLITMGENYIFSEEKTVPWEIKITTPYQIAGVGNKYFIGHYTGIDVTTVTSGVYERYFTYKDEKYHHILDPGTGYPRNSDLLSLSIITKNSMIADAYSTTIFSLGLDAGMKLVEETEGMEAIAITTNKEVYVTLGLENNFVFNEKVREIGYSYEGVYRWN